MKAIFRPSREMATPLTSGGKVSVTIVKFMRPKYPP